jgi:hypothetical protein
VITCAVGGADVDDDTMITQMLYNTNSRHYDTLVTFPKLQITMNGRTKLSIEDVKKGYRIMHLSIKHNHTRDRGNECALFTRNDAVTPGRGYTKVLKGDCRTCGQKGHKSANCWEITANIDKRPPNWKRKNSPAVALLTTSNDKYHCGHFNKDIHTEDRCYKKKR